MADADDRREPPRDPPARDPSPPREDGARAAAGAPPFLAIERAKKRERPVEERVRDHREVSLPLAPDELREQASRCMDCGIPFCHQGCPLGNVIPEWNDLVRRGRLDEAAVLLASTNNFPEITGRVCPAPCEGSCVVALDGEAVTIKEIERSIADHALGAGLLPRPAARPSGKSVAIVGSGPAGLACAQELARRGHAVTVLERDDRVGGLLRYGIPDFKLDRRVLDARLGQMSAEGVRFTCGAHVADRASIDALLAAHDAVVLAIGARAPRDLTVPGRDLDGVHFAMELLFGQNRRNAGDEAPSISVAGERVVVIGGGDTGADCVGTSHRQGAASVLQLEVMPLPPTTRPRDNPWPSWPLVLRTSSSHEEGGTRDWAILTKALRGARGRVTSLDAVRVAFEGGAMREVAGSGVSFACDRVLLAMGFTGPEAPLVLALALARDPRGNIRTDARGATSVPRVFAAGDAVRGQSLVVWAIADGRRVARGVHEALASSQAATRGA